MNLSDQTIGILIGSTLTLITSFLITLVSLIFSERKEKRKQKFELEKISYKYENIEKRRNLDKEKKKNIALIRDFEKSSPPTLLNGLDVTGALLGGINLRTANMQGAILKNTRLQCACLVLANLSGSDFSGANLEGADFTDATLISVNFSGANLRNTIFIDADITNTNFENANLSDCQIDPENLDKAILKHTILPNGLLSD